MKNAATFAGWTAVVVTGLALGACSDPVEGIGPQTSSSSAGGAGAGAQAAASSTTDAATSSAMASSSSTGMMGPVELSFVVDDYFAPSGFMGDGETEGNLPDTNNCPMRAGDEKGECHRIDYNVSSVGWAGIYWQYPDGNWGTEKGLEVDLQAAKITFWAWSEKGGQELNVFAGGIGASDTDYQDSFKAETKISLTSTPMEYTLAVGNQVKDYIIGGFGWSVDGNATGSFVFYLDDIQYEPE